MKGSSDNSANQNLQTQTLKRLVVLSMLCAIIFLLGFTPLGLIPVTPFIKATILHIPVIIGACLLGPKSGAVLGGAFGLVSFINNSFIAPSITSFVFTPIYSLNPDYQGSFGSLLICFLPRILIGVFSALVFRAMFRLFNQKILSQTVAGAVAGLIGALTNTALVLGGIWVLFGSQYEQVREKTMLEIIKIAITGNGIAEAVLAAVLTPIILAPLLKLYGLQWGAKRSS